MDNWIKLGPRYINLANVAEVHLRERPRTAHVFFVGGAGAELDEDDTRSLLGILEQHALIADEVHRRVIPPPSSK
jgi:hypothetical protein